MPTYEYACQACGHRFETFQSIKADPLVDCPSCEEKQLRRMIGRGAGIIFKGSGFYQTDYRKSSGEGGGSSESSSASTKDKGAGTGTSSGASSESKTAAAGTSAAKD